MIISSVCADFRDSNGNTIHRIKAENLNIFQEAPEAIKQDPLFALLVADGSIRFPEDAASRKKLENDPKAGITAEGKSIRKATKRENAGNGGDGSLVPGGNVENRPLVPLMGFSCGFRHRMV